MIWLPVLNYMGNHMKTTIDLSDALMLEAKALAAKRGITFRSVVEEGLRCALREAQQAEAFELQDKSVPGNGLSAEFRNKSWAFIRHRVYEGRGS